MSIHFEDARGAIPALRLGEAEWTELIRRRCGSMRFGSITITVVDSDIVEIEMSVKSRTSLKKPPGRIPLFRLRRGENRNPA